MVKVSLMEKNLPFLLGSCYILRNGQGLWQLGKVMVILVPLKYYPDSQHIVK